MDKPVNQNIPSDDKVHLLGYLIILAKHSRMIIFTSASVTVLTYLILVILPHSYTATARILPPQQNLTLSGQILDSLGGGGTPGGGGGGTGMGGLAANLLGLKSPVDLYANMMTCDTVLDRIIARFNLKEEYKSKYIEDARNALRKKIKITVGKKDNIITIEETSYTPERAAEIVNAFVAELDRLLQGLAVQEAKSRLAFLEKERLQTSQNLNKAEESLRFFSEKNSVLQIDVQTRGVIEYIARLRAEIDSKEVGIQVLRQQATPFNFDIVRMETEVKGLREKLHAAETQHADCISNVCVPFNKAPGLALEYLRLYREAKFQEALYQLYIKLVEIARMDIVRDNAVIQVIDVAKPPERRSNKRLSPSILVGTATLFLTILVAIGWEYIQDMKNQEDDARRLSMLEEYLRPWTGMLIRIKNIIIFKRKY